MPAKGDHPAGLFRPGSHRSWPRLSRKERGPGALGTSCEDPFRSYQEARWAERRVCASQGRDPAPYPVPLYAVSGRQPPDPPGSVQSGQRRKLAASRDSGVHASMVRQDHSLAVAVPACRESILDRPDTGRDDSTGDHGRMLGQAFPAAAVCTFFPSSSPRECPFSQFSTWQARRILSHLREKRPEIVRRNVYGVHAVPLRLSPSHMPEPWPAAPAPALVTCSASQRPSPYEESVLTCKRARAGFEPTTSGVMSKPIAVPARPAPSLTSMLAQPEPPRRLNLSHQAGSFRGVLVTITVTKAASTGHHTASPGRPYHPRTYGVAEYGHPSCFLPTRERRVLGAVDGPVAAIRPFNRTGGAAVPGRSSGVAGHGDSPCKGKTAVRVAMIAWSAG
jgi:hypothetical protein